MPLSVALPESVAAVDLGSNSFHLIVAQTRQGELVVVDRLREMVQLAAGLTESRELGKSARDRALACLERFGERLRPLPAHGVRAVGTNTLRIAHNADAFLAEAEAALGYPIETISGVEEARLIYLGVAQSLPESKARRLVLDIGGGSTELIVGEGGRPLRLDSLYTGCVTLSRTHFPDGEITSSNWQRAELAARQELEPVQSAYRTLGWEQAVGASGTVRSINAVVRAAEWSKEGITHKSLKRVRDAVIEAGHFDQLRFEGLNSRRRNVFAGGVAVLLAAFDALGIERIVPADGALREGLLYDLIGRIRTVDTRSRSVTAVAERYHVDMDQADRVCSTAEALYRQVDGDWTSGGEESEKILRWAALLHEVGLDIAHQHYHKHGEYIVAESDLPGFTREEQRLLATLVRAHRRKLPEPWFCELRRKRAREGEHLAILLRLSVLLHRSRSPDPLPPDIDFSAEKKTVRLGFPKGWLDGAPLTRADLEQERDHLNEVGYTLEFS